MSEEEREGFSILNSPLADAGAGALDLAGGGGVASILLNGLRYGRKLFYERAYAEISENAEKGVGRMPTDEEFHARAQQVEPIRMKADPEKLKLLHRAVVNSFNPELAEAGYTARLIRILDQVEYPDVVALKGITSNRKLWSPKVRAGSDAHGSLLLMVDLRLALKAPGSLQFRCTDLGIRLLRLLREPPEAAPEPTDD